MKYNEMKKSKLNEYGMTKQQVLNCNEWLVIDKNEFHNTELWGKTDLSIKLPIKKKYLVVRSQFEVTTPKKTFNDFDEALGYCKEQSIKFNERCLHDNQKDKHFFTNKEWQYSWNNDQIFRDLRYSVKDMGMRCFKK